MKKQTRGEWQELIRQSQEPLIDGNRSSGLECRLDWADMDTNIDIDTGIDINPTSHVSLVLPQLSPTDNSATLAMRQSGASIARPVATTATTRGWLLFALGMSMVDVSCLAFTVSIAPHRTRVGKTSRVPAKPWQPTLTSLTRTSTTTTLLVAGRKSLPGD